MEMGEFEVEESVGVGSCGDPTIVEFENGTEDRHEKEHEREHGNEHENEPENEPENEHGNFLENESKTRPELLPKNHEDEPKIDLTQTPNIKGSQRKISPKNTQNSLQIDETNTEESSQKLKRLSVNDIKTVSKRAKTSAGIISGNYTSDENIADDARTEFLSDTSDDSDGNGE